MYTVGEEVNTQYGAGTIVHVGGVKPMLYVRLRSSLEIFVLNHSQVATSRREGRPDESPSAPPGNAERADNSPAEGAGENTPDSSTDRWRGQMKHKKLTEQTPLAVFVQNRLTQMGMKQSEFCRLTGFDQGLLSKIQSSMITNLSLETALRLAVGLDVPPEEILTLIDRADLHALITQAYPGSAGPAPCAEEMPATVIEINRLAMRAYGLGRSLSPVIGVLAHLAITRGEKPPARALEASSAEG